MNKTLELTKEFGEIKNGIMLWIPEYQQYLAISNGDGTNLDSVENGCDDYVYYSVYEYCSGDFTEVDGGQMDYSTKEIDYNENIIMAIPDILEFAYDDREIQFVVLHSWE